MTSMLDQYEQASQGLRASKSNISNLLSNSAYPNTDMDDELPIFTKQKMNFSPSATITHLAVANDRLVLAMANNMVFRIDLEKPNDHEEISISKYTQSGHKVNNIFIDPLGCHVLLSLISQTQDPDLLYLHKKSTKIKSVNKSKNNKITAVGWNFQNTSDTLTGPILFGTSQGLILETEISPDGDKMFQSGIEQYWKQVYDIGKGKEAPISGIEFRKVGSNNYFIFVATSTRLYQFLGYVNGEERPLLQQIFNSYLNMPETGFIEIASDIGYSKFHMFTDKTSKQPKTVGWMTKAGIFHGQLDMDLIQSSKSIMKQADLVSYPEQPESEKVNIPITFVLTEFHALVMYEDCVRVVSLLNKNLISEDFYTESFGKLINIVKDPTRHTIWAITDKSVFRYKILKEHRNAWKMYVEKNQFELAKKYCNNNSANLDKINVKQAEMLFSNGEFEKSALIYADTRSSFESICLKYLDIKNSGALRVFLKRKLENFKYQDKIQTTMLVIWIVELYVSDLSKLRYTEPDNTTKYEALQQEFNEFMAIPNVKTCVKRNRSVIYDIMSSHGDKENLIKLTVVNKDFENVIRQHIYKKTYVEALNVLKNQTRLELFYHFSPTLMQEIPKLTVSALIEKGKNLNPSKLLPALVSCETDALHVKEMIRYLEFCVQSIKCTDQAIHNYLLSLYVEHDTDSLMKYLTTQGQIVAMINYDVHYALRLCREKQLTEACVKLSMILGLWESAVDLALDVDINLAKRVANMVEEEELRKKLWLKIAEYVINGKQDIEQAMEFLQQCELIKIEDILPFFSDFVTIDHFREPICSSLQEYNQQIQDLREEMEEATKSADQVRSEIQSFRNKSTVISVSEVCTLCQITLLLRPFYLFPCGHKFHSDCLTTELQTLLGPAKKNKLANLQRQLNSQYMSETNEDFFSAKPSTKQKLRNEIDNILASECLYCGEYMIQAIDTPFIPDSEWDKVMKEWE